VIDYIYGNSLERRYYWRWSRPMPAGRTIAQKSGGTLGGWPMRRRRAWGVRSAAKALRTTRVFNVTAEVGTTRWIV